MFFLYHNINFLKDIIFTKNITYRASAQDPFSKRRQQEYKTLFLRHLR